jgi:hypothetical protein
MSAAADYPFSNWSDYFAAFQESLASEFYGATYPMYEKAQEHCDVGDVDVAIVKELLGKGLEAQGGLDRLVDAVVDYGRYAPDFKGTINDMAQVFAKNGARFKCEKIFQLKFESPEHFEDEVIFIYARGIMLDVLIRTYGVDLSPYVQYIKAIEATYWEDIPLDKYDYQTAFLMALKGESKFLSQFK